eukprot:TRINITY_DN12931_c0_g1_i1.p1 TRINITY_DN12931_c0_g1~~TRINITY_DN12931_c0_g1_i1.p1  ORF type:complete len:239 (-),score=12.52 TRINITY_DN12931_c0_g1_i1:259-975(-)
MDGFKKKSDDKNVGWNLFQSLYAKWKETPETARLLDVASQDYLPTKSKVDIFSKSAATDIVLSVKVTLYLLGTSNKFTQSVGSKIQRHIKTLCFHPTHPQSFDILKELRSMRYLRFGRNLNANPDTLPNFVAIIEKSLLPSLRTLDFSRCNLTDDFCIGLCKGLTSNTTVTSMSLEWTRITDSSVGAIATLLCSQLPETLININLCHTDLSSGGRENLRRQLKKTNAHRKKKVRVRFV